VTVKPILGALFSTVAVLLAGCAHAPAATPSEEPMDRVISLETFDHALLSRAIFRETNHVRAAHGLRPLAPLPGLDDAADDQAWYTALDLHAGHGNPLPSEHNVAERVAHFGLQASRVAENSIMMQARRPVDAPNSDYTYAEYAALLLEGWMNSPDHRENVLNPVFRNLGCGARLAHGLSLNDQRIFAIQVFFLAQPVALDPR
jgi:uncharacterized protein YkwD